jgi:hypothetical protein
LALNKLGYNLFYYGIQGSLERMGVNFGVTMLVIGINEFLSYLAFSYFVTRIPRRAGLMISIFVTSSIGLLFLLPVV